jgi:hypothetical protein
VDDLAKTGINVTLGVEASGWVDQMIDIVFHKVSWAASRPFQGKTRPYVDSSTNVLLRRNTRNALVVIKANNAADTITTRGS